MTNHKHLRTVIEDIYTNNNELTDDLLLKLIHEFRYSNLIIPAKRENGTLNFIIYEDEGAKITPLFTDMDEFMKFYRDEDIRSLKNPFEVYHNIIKTTEIEGFILNPSSEKYLFKKEFILSITSFPKTSFFSNNPYSLDELRTLKKSMDNSPLESFINAPGTVGDYEGLFEALSNSTLLTMMVSRRDLSSLSKDGLIDMHETGPLASMYLDTIGGEYATLFSSDAKIREVPSGDYRYSQIVNLATLVNFVLSEDMDGIVLNPQTDNVLIPRAKLLRYSTGFEKFANDGRLSDSIFYLFEVE